MNNIKKLALVLLIIGLVIGLSPVAGQLYTKYQGQRMMDELLDSEDTAVVEENTDADPEEGYSQLQQVLAPESSRPEETGANASPTSTQEQEPASDTEASAEAEKQMAKQKVLGIIKIDKIKVQAPIVEGVKASNLKTGIGHIPGTAALGSPGNCALAGHRSYTFGKFFNRLDELVIGDEILVITKKEEMKFKVYKKLVVKPDDVSVLKGTKDKNIITLITCTPIYVASHRLIVHAELEDRVPRQSD